MLLVCPNLMMRAGEGQGLDGVRALKQLIQRELDRRPSFEPVRFRVAIPRTMKVPSGKCGSYSFTTRSGQIPNSRAWIKGMEYLLTYSGYVVIHGTDGRAVVIDIDQSANAGNPQSVSGSPEERQNTKEN
jgi:hypothetical protein